MAPCKVPCHPDVKRFPLWEALSKEPPHFCVSCPDDKKGPILNGMRKDIVRMEPPVGNEYGGCPAAGGVPVNQPAQCGKPILFPYGLDDGAGINLAQQVIHGHKVHLVIAFFGTPAWAVIAFGVLWVPCEGEAGAVTCKELVPAI